MSDLPRIPEYLALYVVFFIPSILEEKVFQNKQEHVPSSYNVNMNPVIVNVVCMYPAPMYNPQKTCILCIFHNA